MFNIDDLMFKPFKWGAAGPDAYDCYNLCREVCRRAGIYLPEKKSIYQMTARHVYINHEKNRICQRLPKPKPFCLALFKVQPPFVTHIGVVMPDCKNFIHVMQKSNVSIERLDAPLWSRILDGFFEYVGTE